ncbi:macrophage mannose receptor 1-like isoform X6, partial [Clarias magur]
LVAVSVLQTVPYKYSLVMKSMTWSNAQSYCRTMYTDLATIVNATDWQKLEKERASKYFTGPAWIGLYNNINNWRWSLNDVPLNTLLYINWSPWSSTFAGETACSFIGAYYYWWDTLCSLQYAFICYN